MRLAVVGAGGRVGRQLLALAHARGNVVKALVRGRARLNDAPPITGVIEGNVFDPDSLDATLAGCDTVISTIGVRGLGKTTLYSRGTSSILASMQRTGVRRFVGISAAGVETDPALSGLMASVVVPLVYGEILTDMRAMEDVLARCHVDWTAVRPPHLTDGPHTGVYRENDRFLPTGGTQLARADLADFLLRVALEGLYVRGRPAVAY